MMEIEPLTKVLTLVHGGFALKAWLGMAELAGRGLLQRDSASGGKACSELSALRRGCMTTWQL